MYEDKLKEIRSLKAKATALRNRKQYSRAIETLDKAIEGLEALRIERDEKDTRSELSDTYGMKGGVYRRMEDLSNALKMYEKGKVIEDIDQVSSYNLSNFISLNIELSNKSPLDVEIKKDLTQAIERLSTEIQGSRKDEWWAWSDLGQSYLLLNQPENARQCYRDARKKTGPSSDEVQRHAEILKVLAEKIANVTPEISTNILSVADDELLV
jgi:tetratricopeptide (TPR) repeat protein